MRDETPYNPLDKRHLGESVANAMLERPVEPLPPSSSFMGAGIYAIYYTGNFPPYRQVAEMNRGERFRWPIYVGKAIPKGGRRGNAVETTARPYLFSRLRKHGSSVEQVNNLNLADFHCRYLVVDDIWIPLGETLLIQRTLPIWNTTLDGFGNHDPGGGRRGQRRSPWDAIHPGRSWAADLPENQQSEAELLAHLQESISRNLGMLAQE